MDARCRWALVFFCDRPALVYTVSKIPLLGLLPGLMFKAEAPCTILGQHVVIPGHIY